MTRTTELQIAEALKHAMKLTYNYQSVSIWDHVQTAMRDLLAGKFAEEPLPEIVKPGWPTKNPPHIFKQANGLCCVAVGEPSEQSGWSSLYGPSCKTEREAIEAWNAVMGK